MSARDCRHAEQCSSMPNASGLRAGDSAHTTHISEAVSNPSPKTTPTGYICAKVLPLSPPAASTRQWARTQHCMLTFQEASTILRSGLPNLTRHVVGPVSESSDDRCRVFEADRSEALSGSDGPSSSFSNAVTVSRSFLAASVSRSSACAGSSSFPCDSRRL